MRTLVHLSDIHFGRVDYGTIKPLVAFVTEVKPDVTVISGDFTQRARQWQFKEARHFLDSLPRPQVVVPGNHDVPLYNVFARFLWPLHNYKRYITDDLEPFYSDGEIAIMGVSTARSLTIKDGRINERQIARIRERLCAFADEITKIVVTHHPFELPEGHDEEELLGRAQMAMEALAPCGADLFLSGHLHLSFIGHTATRYKIKGHSALIVQAGTATSTRGRGEANSFNVIRIEHPHITVERIQWQPDSQSFVVFTTERFNHTPDGWMRLTHEMPKVESAALLI